jgi:hypothetical protein
MVQLHIRTAPHVQAVHIPYERLSGAGIPAETGQKALQKQQLGSRGEASCPGGGDGACENCYGSRRPVDHRVLEPEHASVSGTLLTLKPTSW